MIKLMDNNLKTTIEMKINEGDINALIKFSNKDKKKFDKCLREYQSLYLENAIAQYNLDMAKYLYGYIGFIPLKNEIVKKLIINAIFNKNEEIIIWILCIYHDNIDQESGNDLFHEICIAGLFDAAIEFYKLLKIKFDENKIKVITDKKITDWIFEKAREAGLKNICKIIIKMRVDGVEDMMKKIK